MPVVSERHVDDLFFPVGERGLYLPKKAGDFMPSGYKAVIRAGEDAPVVLSVVKNSYKLMKHREVYDAILPVIEPYKTEIKTYHDRDGAKAYIDVRFLDVVKGFGGANINFRTIFYNGYGGSSFGAMVGAINAFCTNGCIVGDYESVYRRHTSGLDASVAQGWIRDGLAKWEVVTEKWVQWQNTGVAGLDLDATFKQMTDNQAHVDRMIRTWDVKYQPVYGSNLFSVYQTLTDYASHFDQYKLRAVNSNSPHQREMDLLVRAEGVMRRIAA